MSLLSVIIIAIALGLDSFVALWAIGASANCQSRKIFVRLSLLIGLFHFGMPLIGSLFSRLLINYIYDYSIYLSAAIFALLGFKMIKEAFDEDETSVKIDISKAILLSYALSIDALSVGFSLMLIEESYSIYLISLIFAVGAFLMSYTGYYLGKRCSFLNKRATYIVGGLVLIALGVKSIL